MSEKKKNDAVSTAKVEKVKLYDVLVTGATDGLTGEALLAHVRSARPDKGDKALAKVGLSALSDAKIAERPVLDAIYGLVMQIRFGAPVTDHVDEGHSNDDTPVKKRRKKVA